MQFKTILKFNEFNAVAAEHDCLPLGDPPQRHRTARRLCAGAVLEGAGRGWDIEKFEWLINCLSYLGKSVVFALNDLSRENRRAGARRNSHWPDL
jgi:hypothetical protein